MKQTNSRNIDLSNTKLSLATEPIQIGALIYKYIYYWPYFVVSLVVFLLAAFIYLKYTTPIYSSSIKILIKDDKSSGQLTENAVFDDLGIEAQSQNTENEIEILKSTNLMRDVVRNLGLQYRCFKKGYVRDVDLYNDGPVKVLEWSPKDSSSSKKIKLLLGSKKSDNLFTAEVDGKVYKGYFGSALKLPHGSLTLVRNNIENYAAIEKIYLEILDLDQVAGEYASALSLSVIGKKSTVLLIRLSDVHPKRAKDILNELIHVYDISQVKDKNRILKNTLEFIDDRVNIISREVGEVEGDVQSFKSSNQITNLTAEGDLIMQEQSANNKELTDIAVQDEILKGIQTFLNKNPGQFEFVPTNSGLTNLALSGLLESFNNLLLEREKVKVTYGSGHPNNGLLEQQLSNLRSNILQNINSIQRDLQASRNVFKMREQSLNSRLNILPLQERQLIEIQRQQSIKQNLYLYLLQKREETALKLAAAIGNSRVVEPAHNGRKVFPQSQMIWILGLLSGLLIPIIVISIFQILNNKVTTEKDIITNTNVPIIAGLKLDKHKRHIVVQEKSRSQLAEMFRLLRANLNFVGEGLNNKTILITSSSSGEGKSFVCINLGLTLAFTGKKVLLLELDLRKPKFVRYLSITNQDRKGISEYLVNESMHWSRIINSSELHPNLFFSNSGPTPPNPNELLQGERFASLITTFKEEFDYIIIDTPPVGIISDSLLLNKWVDTTLYVVRYGKTEKAQLGIIENISANQQLPRPYIVFNGFKDSRRSNGYGYGYDYGYGYGYGYGYYQEDQKK